VSSFFRGGKVLILKRGIMINTAIIGMNDGKKEEGKNERLEFSDVLEVREDVEELKIDND
jgi:hypothetical protein